MSREDHEDLRNTAYDRRYPNERANAQHRVLVDDQVMRPGVSATDVFKRLEKVKQRINGLKGQAEDIAQRVSGMSPGPLAKDSDNLQGPGLFRVLDRMLDEIEGDLQRIDDANISSLQVLT